MTEVSTEPVAIPAPAPPPPPAPAAVEQAPAETGSEHTPGGWPVVPLALAGANSTVGMVATAALAGGPIAAAVAATGAVVLGTVAGTRSRKTNPRKEARRTAARAAGRSAARSAALRRGGAGAPGGSNRGRSSAGAGRSGGKPGKGPGQHRRGAGTSARHGSTATGTAGKPRSTGKGTAEHATGAVGKGAGKVGQVKALRRSAQQGVTGSRAGQRVQTTGARRAVADARRNAKARTAGGGSGLPHRASRRGGMAGRMLGGAARKARAARDAAVSKNRAQRDVKAAGAVAAKRAAVRRAPVRRAARQALRRSAARFHGRRLLAALLALPLGLLGLVTSPIGRKLGLPWLIHPGRRLFRRLAGVAAEERATRDEVIRQEQAEREAAADAEATADGADGIADGVERPATQVPTSTNTESSEGEHVSGFRFEEAAAEMEQAANSYDPENAMEILAMVEGLPAALTSVANVMKILAERSDSEFPLEKEVADGFNDIFGAVMSAVAVAEDMGPLFRQAHEQDIARHEDPRNGTEAEKGWNV
ncbi:hypothetical protein KVH02_11455 [Streptomyces olivaceus]|uniref:Uncharacterized protein n=1 Tax=Streptomyces olivaceus TaxID=47716 RepID=A0ABS7W0N8_STROV|nr:hypothetical protein [Streptomyces olivaceus]MBZ6088939.1 hypothetical protein [Streptomyces olivaceus]MBZ6095687.1 hypothetical protein [Streptomyces olivaceus]MBZ6119956.1 hypothetical protein [Streptomyces olivaceus]MBZ6151507.1 hypothetical protein [Streptomyces olivaceus]MBZ6298371.1 hypothetical protein [Streptomyces olivaceus]